MNWEKVVDELKVKREGIDRAIATITETFLTNGNTPKRPAVQEKVLERWHRLRGGNKGRGKSQREVGVAYMEQAKKILRENKAPMREADITSQIVGEKPSKPLGVLKSAVKRGELRMKKHGKAQTSPVTFTIKEE